MGGPWYIKGTVARDFEAIFFIPINRPDLLNRDCELYCTVLFGTSVSERMRGIFISFRS